MTRRSERPEQGGFRFVATTARLLLFSPRDAKEKPAMRSSAASNWPVVRGSASVARDACAAGACSSTSRTCLAVGKLQALALVAWALP